MDLIRSTRHDEFALADYERLRRCGIKTARDGLRWTLIERANGTYDFSSALPMLHAARQAGVQVIWDLWHYGWPDDIDIFSAAFVNRFSAFAAEAVKHLSEYAAEPYVSAINEISFFSWAGGQEGVFNPFAKRRGDELKRQLVRATIEAVHAMRAVNPAVKLFQIDPIINVVPRTATMEDVEAADRYRRSQFAAWDMILGRSEPEIGGAESFIDVIGANYYIHNQWVFDGPMIVPSDSRYRHVSAMLQELYDRYRRPVFVAETGIEDEARPAWLRYMCKEVFFALTSGVPVEGLCLYPIVNHPGWDDDRHCHNGLFDYADERGERPVYEPLAEELARQSVNLASLQVGDSRVNQLADLETSALDWAAHVMQDRTDESRSE